MIYLLLIALLQNRWQYNKQLKMFENTSSRRETCHIDRGLLF